MMDEFQSSFAEEYFARHSLRKLFFHEIRFQSSFAEEYFASEIESASRPGPSFEFQSSFAEEYFARKK